MDISDQIKTVEEELLKLIIDHLKANKLDALKAQSQAKDFLALLPISNQEDLLNKLKSLGNEYSEANTIYLKEFGKAQSEKEQIALNNMSIAIKQGNIEHALATARSLQQGGQQ